MIGFIFLKNFSLDHFFFVTMQIYLYDTSLWCMANCLCVSLSSIDEMPDQSLVKTRHETQTCQDFSALGLYLSLLIGKYL
jgi:hypothetical protein